MEKSFTQSYSRPKTKRINHDLTVKPLGVFLITLSFFGLLFGTALGLNSAHQAELTTQQESYVQLQEEAISLREENLVLQDSIVSLEEDVQTLDDLAKEMQEALMYLSDAVMRTDN